MYVKCMHHNVNIYFCVQLTVNIPKTCGAIINPTIKKLRNGCVQRQIENSHFFNVKEFHI